MFADGYLLTQLIPIFLLLKIKRCFENLVILLTWIRPGSGLIKFCGSGSGSGYDQSGSTSLILRILNQVVILYGSDRIWLRNTDMYYSWCRQCQEIWKPLIFLSVASILCTSLGGDDNKASSLGKTPSTLLLFLPETKADFASYILLKGVPLHKW